MKLLTFLLQFSIYFTFWILLSGKYDMLHLFLGIISSLFVAFVTWNGSLFTDKKQFYRIPRIMIGLTLYMAWLSTRIAKAALHVSCLILNPKMPIQSRFIHYKTVLQGKSARIIFGNSITLTPGTITVNIEDNNLLIHTLDNESAQDILTGELEKRISNIFINSKDRKELTKTVSKDCMEK